MNFLFILVGICATFGLIGLVIGIKSQSDRERGERQRTMPRVPASTWSRSRTNSRLLCAFISILGFIALCPHSLAQQVVHAMGGTVTSVDTKSLTLTMQSDQGYTTRFQALPKAKADTMLDKQVAALGSPAEQLAKIGDHIVVLYVGDNSILSALAIEDLGPAPTALHDGTVTGFDRHSHILTLKGGPTPDTLSLSEKTLVDTPDGVTTGLKYKPSKGDHIQVKSVQGAQDALFLSVAT